MTSEAKKEKDILEITKGENANLAGMEPRCPECDVPDAMTFHGNCTVSCRACKKIFQPHLLADFAQFFRSPAPTPPLDVISKQLQKVFDYFMGPNACGDFTCNCNKPEVCGVCEIRLETASLLRRHIARPAPQLKLKIQELVGLPVDREIEDDLVFRAVKALHHAVGLCQHSHWGASPAQPEKRDECKCVGYLAGDRYATDTSPCSLHREVAPQSGKEGQ